MKIKVFKPNHEEESKLLLGLEQADDSVVVVALDKFGKTIPAGNLMSITPNGVVMFPDISNSVGIELNKSGQLHVIKSVI